MFASWRSVKKIEGSCAAKAFYSCPAIISRCPGSQNTPKESQLNPEEDSRIKQARSHVTLEKSSKNYKPSEEWAKPNLTPDVTPPPSQCLGECFRRVCHVEKAWIRENHTRNWGAKDRRQDQGGGRGVRGLIYLINGLKEMRPIQNEGSQWCAAPFMFTWLWSTGHRWSRASLGVFI